VSGQAVIGLQWGDEAKGKLVDLLTRGKDIVVRYQGGANAGHTVVVGKDVYKLHHIPSGIINDNVLNIVAPGVVIHPGTILKEIDSLVERGIDVQSRMKLSERAHIVMPWHMLEDKLWNAQIKGSDNIGTTLRGIGPCYRDKVGRSFAVRLGDLIRDDFAQKIEKICAIKRTALSAIAGDDAVELDPKKIFDEFKGYANRLAPYISDTTRTLLDATEEGKKLLFEGAQGSLLDIDHGTFPFVTSSNSSGVGICVGSGLPPKWVNEIIGVAKCYSTRVGGGPFPTELDDEVGELIRVTGNEFGTTTGRPRRCGWFDAVAVRYTRRLSGISKLSLMMLDVLSVLDEIKICVAYELDGERITHFPSSADDLERCKPIYETLPGWKVDVTGARELADLPENALKYVRRVEELIGCEAGFISIGPDRAQTIVLTDGARVQDLVSSH
jgi:adenylosuccinate synthase